MTLNYIVKDDKGNVGKLIPFTQGETRIITVFLLNADGTPYVHIPSVSELVLKIFSNINQASIQKKLSLTQVALMAVSGVLSGTIGFQFTLLAADTLNMAANNSGLPMIATLTDGSGNVFELDFISIFSVTPPVVLT